MFTVEFLFVQRLWINYSSLMQNMKKKRAYARAEKVKQLFLMHFRLHLLELIITNFKNFKKLHIL